MAATMEKSVEKVNDTLKTMRASDELLGAGCEDCSASRASSEQSDTCGSVTSIPELPSSESVDSTDQETFNCVPAETPNVPIAQAESMDIPNAAAAAPQHRPGDAAQAAGPKGVAAAAVADTARVTTTKKLAGNQDGATACAAPPTAGAGAAAKVTKVRRADKGIEHILHALKSLETPEEKLAALCKRYTDLLDDHRLLQNKFKLYEKKLNNLVRDKEQLQSEHSKAMLAKSKLENLCRELQRHSKMVKDESIARAKEEEEKRKEVTAKFQSTINDIKEQVSDHTDKNTKLREENIELVAKLKALIEQYEQREQYVEKMLKHKDLEIQLVEAKCSQAEMKLTEEKEVNLKEKQLWVAERADHQHKIELLQNQEEQLRNQVSLYTEKYEQFQDTLSQSQNVFQAFKTDMDKMTKKIKRLEKETLMWKVKWEKSNHTLLEMAEDKTHRDKQLGVMQTRIDKLQSLCRALQDERRRARQDKDSEESGCNSKEDSPAPQVRLDASLGAVGGEDAPGNGSELAALDDAPDVPDAPVPHECAARNGDVINNGVHDDVSDDVSSSSSSSATSQQHVMKGDPSPDGAATKRCSTDEDGARGDADGATEPPAPALDGAMAAPAPQ